MDPQEAIRRNRYKLPRNRTRKNVAKRYEKTDKDANIVYSYSAYGATNEDIAAILGMDNKTLTKYFPEELKSGRATAKGKIAQRLYNIGVGKEAVLDPETKEVIVPAVAPNLTALIFLAKTRLGWKETQIVEQNVDLKSSGVKIYLPDNGMKKAKWEDD